MELDSKLATILQQPVMLIPIFLFTAGFGSHHWGPDLTPHSDPDLYLYKLPN
jgi:hypothetical protein